MKVIKIIIVVSIFLLSFWVYAYAEDLVGARILNQALDAEYSSIGTLYPDGFHVTLSLSMESRYKGKQINKATCTSTIEELLGSFWFDKMNGVSGKHLKGSYRNNNLFLVSYESQPSEPYAIDSDIFNHFMHLKKSIFDDWKNRYEHYKTSMIFTNQKEEFLEGKEVHVITGKLSGNSSHYTYHDISLLSLNLESKIEKTTHIPLSFILNVEYAQKNNGGDAVYFKENFELTITERHAVPHDET